MKILMRLLRVDQWVKNLFCFLPVVFSGNLLDGDALLRAFEAFIVFSLTASSTI